MVRYKVNIGLNSHGKIRLRVIKISLFKISKDNKPILPFIFEGKKFLKFFFFFSEKVLSKFSIENLIMERKAIKIPIEKYEKDLETEFSKDKKNEILDLLTNANQLFYIDDFEEIEYKLHEACKNGDIELIQLI